MTQVTPVSFERMRQAMVSSQLRTNAVSDPRVISAMSQVPREQFVPDALRSIAYRDTPLPIGAGRMQNAPLATGRLITEASIGVDDHVLVIGVAGGYAAAVVAKLAETVIALESDAELAALARTAIGDEPGVELVEGPLAQGWARAAPYDVIVIDGAVEAVPAAIIDQLRPGGRMVTGLVDRGVTRLASGEKTAGGFGLFDFADVDCVVLPGFEQPRGFTF